MDSRIAIEISDFSWLLAVPVEILFQITDCLMASPNGLRDLLNLARTNQTIRKIIDDQLRLIVTVENKQARVNRIKHPVILAIENQSQNFIALYGNNSDFFKSHYANIPDSYVLYRKRRQAQVEHRNYYPHNLNRHSRQELHHVSCRIFMERVILCSISLIPLVALMCVCPSQSSQDFIELTCQGFIKFILECQGAAKDMLDHLSINDKTEFIRDFLAAILFVIIQLVFTVIFGYATKGADEAILFLYHNFLRLLDHLAAIQKLNERIVTVAGDLDAIQSITAPISFYNWLEKIGLNAVKDDFARKIPLTFFRRIIDKSKDDKVENLEADIEMGSLLRTI